MQEATVAPPKKRGRPAKAKPEKRSITVPGPDGFPREIVLPEQTSPLTEKQTFTTSPAGQKRNKPPCFSGKCVEIMVYKKEGESGTVFAHPGECPPIWFRREYKLIVPVEYVEALNSANGFTTVMSDWDNPREDWSIPLVEIPFIRFPYQVFAEKTWDEYCAFRDAQVSKPTNPARR